MLHPVWSCGSVQVGAFVRVDAIRARVPSIPNPRQEFGSRSRLLTQGRPLHCAKAHPHAHMLLRLPCAVATSACSASRVATQHLPRCSRVATLAPAAPASAGGGGANGIVIDALAPLDARMAIGEPLGTLSTHMHSGIGVIQGHWSECWRYSVYGYSRSSVRGVLKVRLGNHIHWGLRYKARTGEYYIYR